MTFGYQSGFSTPSSREKPGFDIETARITGKTAVSTDDTVAAWHYDANRVVVHRTADGPRRNLAAVGTFRFNRCASSPYETVSP